MPEKINQIIYTGLRAPDMLLEPDNKVKLYHHPTIRVDYDIKLEPQKVQDVLSQDCYPVFLSRNGVVGLNAWMQSSQTELSFQGKPIWSVGKQTSNEIRSTLGVEAGEPLEQNAQGLIRLFKTIKPRPVVLFCAEDPRPDFPNWLKESGWSYKIFPVYRTLLVQNEDLAKRFDNSPNESIIFTSPSTVMGFIKSLNLTDLRGVKSRLISIGPSTSETISQFSGKLYEEASEPDIRQLLKQIINEMGQ